MAVRQVYHNMLAVLGYSLGSTVLLIGLSGCNGQQTSNRGGSDRPDPEPTKNIVIAPVATPTPESTTPAGGGHLSNIRIHEKGVSLVSENYDLTVVTDAPLALGKGISHRGDYEIENPVLLGEEQ